MPVVLRLFIITFKQQQDAYETLLCMELNCLWANCVRLCLCTSVQEYEYVCLFEQAYIKIVSWSLFNGIGIAIVEILMQKRGSDYAPFHKFICMYVVQCTHWILLMMFFSIPFFPALHLLLSFFVSFFNFFFLQEVYVRRKYKYIWVIFITRIHCLHAGY